MQSYSHETVSFILKIYMQEVFVFSTKSAYGTATYVRSHFSVTRYLLTSLNLNRPTQI